MPSPEQRSPPPPPLLPHATRPFPAHRCSTAIHFAQTINTLKKRAACCKYIVSLLVTRNETAPYMRRVHRSRTRIQRQAPRRARGALLHQAPRRARGALLHQAPGREFRYRRWPEIPVQPLACVRPICRTACMPPVSRPFSGAGAGHIVGRVGRKGGGRRCPLVSGQRRLMLPPPPPLVRVRQPVCVRACV
jgi:hypothetical protein